MPSSSRSSGAGPRCPRGRRGRGRWSARRARACAGGSPAPAPARAGGSCRPSTWMPCVADVVEPHELAARRARALVARDGARRRGARTASRSRSRSAARRSRAAGARSRAAAVRCIGDRTTSVPNTSIAPLAGRSRVVIIRIVVVLPAPLGPSRPNTSPVRHGERHAVDRANIAERVAKVDGVDGRDVVAVWDRFRGRRKTAHVSPTRSDRRRNAGSAASIARRSPTSSSAIARCDDLASAVPAIGDASPRGGCELEPRGSRVVGVGATGDEPRVDQATDERAHRVGDEAERLGRFPHPRAGPFMEQHHELDLGLRQRPVRPVAVNAPTDATPQTQDDLHQLPRHVAGGPIPHRLLRGRHPLRIPL